MWLLLVGLWLLDIIFSYFVFWIEIVYKLHVNAELSLEIIFPGEVNLWVVFIISWSIMGWAYYTDNKRGKFNVFMLGNLFAIVAYCFATLDCNVRIDSIDFKEFVFVLAAFPIVLYLGISPTRNIMILEQIKVPSNVDSVRYVIFGLVYTRLINRFIIHKFHLAQNVQSKLAHFIAGIVGIAGMHIFLKIFVAKRLHLERAEEYIWKTCIGVFLGGVRGLCGRGKKYKQTLRTKNRSSLVVVPSENSLKAKADKIESVAPKNNRFDAIADVFKKALPTDTISTVFQRVLLAPFPTPDPIREELLKDYLDHWLCRAKEFYNQFVIRQTVYLWKVIPFIIIGVLFVNLTFMVTALTLYQAKFVGNENIDVKLLIMTYELILFPFIEFYFLPLISGRLRRCMYLIPLGYFILLLAYLSAVLIQSNLAKNITYLPKPNETNIRFYNAMDTTLTITYKNPYPVEVNVVEREIELISHIKLLEFLGFVISRQGNNTKEVLNYTSEFGDMANFIITKTESIHLKNLKTQAKEGDQSMAKYLVISPYPSPTVSNFIESTGNWDVEIKTKAEELVKVIPGNYSITVGNTNSQSPCKITSSLMEAGAVYVLFLFEKLDGSDKNCPKKLYRIENPILFYDTDLFLQIFLISLANAICTISYFRFILLESPETMRTTVYSLFVSMSILFTSYLNHDNFVIELYDNLYYMFGFFIFHLTTVGYSVWITIKFPYKLHG